MIHPKNAGPTRERVNAGKFIASPKAIPFGDLVASETNLFINKLTNT